MIIGKCKKKVYPKERWGSFHPHQCRRDIWKDGYCKTHHPDTEKARQVAREKRWKEEEDARRKNSPLLLLQKAIKKIEELERQLASSNSIREAEKKILIDEIEINTKLKVEKEEAFLEGYRKGYDEGIKDGVSH
jgi:flagellar biosynthesis/type III secretory pathway protein FliH